MDIATLVPTAAGGVLGVAGWIWYKAQKRKLAGSPSPPKGQKRLKTFALVLSILGAWLFTVGLLTLIFGKGAKKELSVELGSEKLNIFGISISRTVVVTWILMAALIAAALLIRIFAVRKFSDKPTGLQNVLELCVEWLERYTGSQAPEAGTGSSFGAYIFTVAVFMIGSAVVELFGERAPTADLTMTFALALITFFLLNYYGIKKKGLGGRLKSLASPTPVIFPIRVICDVAIPVSLACRLFGNMLGGMIVMDLLYMALGNAAVGIPSVAGLYFNVFHPLIQAFIFITLTLSYINETTE